WLVQPPGSVHSHGSDGDCAAITTTSRSPTSDRVGGSIEIDRSVASAPVVTDAERYEPSPSCIRTSTGVGIGPSSRKIGVSAGVPTGISSSAPSTSTPDPVPPPPDDGVSHVTSLSAFDAFVSTCPDRPPGEIGRAHV